MSDFFERNCQAMALNAANAPLLSRIQNTVALSEPEVYETADGGLTLIFRETSLHDANGAIQEAQQLVKEHCRPAAKGMHLLLGLGLGYPLAEITHKTQDFPESLILVYEPFLPLLRFVMENVDLTPYFSKRNIIITDNRFELEQLIAAHYVWQKTEIDFTTLPSYAHLAHEDITGILAKITEIIKLQQDSLKIGLLLSPAWLRHFVGNLPYWPACLPFENLEGRFQGKHAIVVGGGPSLDAAIETLADNQDRLVVIATTRAVRSLLAKGVQPDFILAIDYEGPDEQLSGLETDLKNTRFILGPYAAACTFLIPSAGRFSVNLSKFPVVPWVDKLLKRETAPVDVLGTVSYLGVQTAITLGCASMTLIGMDLAFSGDRQYAENATTSEQRIEEGHLIVQDSKDYTDSKVPMVDTVGQNGETLRTPIDYEMYRKHFETFAELCQHENHACKLFNASIGGVAIKGFETLALQEVLFRLSPEPFDKSAPLQNLVMPSEETLQAQSRAILSGVEDLVERTEAARQVMDGILETLDGIDNFFQWEGHIDQYYQLQKQLRDILSGDSLLSMILSTTSYHYNKAMIKNPAEWDAVSKNIGTTMAFIDHCRKTLCEELYPVLLESREKLSDQAALSRRWQPLPENV
ncbi:MAG: 6-hydroxymethylpterin diphosphokinase MptE-like protein [Vampirovibrionales bacterium]|nr:6-hydroxymethylpterin diphosphokinase MptE-like protein [Vampirovibrionales bacterium]